MTKLLEELKKLCYQCGEIALDAKKKGLNIDIKSDNSPVTQADKAIDRLICQTLQKISPDIPIISEEGNTSNISNHTYWLIDPIDGTRSYVKGEDTYTVNIALIKNYLPVIGFIYQPENKTLHYTNSEGKLVVEQNFQLVSFPFNNNHTGLIGTCTPTLPLLMQQKIKKYFNLDQLLLISSSKKLCLVSDQTVDIYICNSYAMEWDIAAGNALVLAGGGNFITMECQPFLYGNKDFKTPHFFALSKRMVQHPKTEGLIKNYLTEVYN